MRASEAVDERVLSGRLGQDPRFAPSASRPQAVRHAAEIGAALVRLKARKAMSSDSRRPRPMVPFFSLKSQLHRFVIFSLLESLPA